MRDTNSKWKTMLFILLIGMVLLTACGADANAARANNRGNRAYEAGDLDRAVENYTEAELENPTLPEPFYNAGNALLRRGEIDRAEIQLRQALRLSEKQEGKEAVAQQGSYNLGNLAYLQERWGDAIEWYKQALRLQPDDADAKHNLELALRQQQQQQQEQQPQGGGQNNQDQQDNQNGQEGESPPSQGDQPQDNQGGQGQEPQPQGGGENNQDQQESRRNLTPDEARQLLDALGQNSQTLQERLGQQFKAPSLPPSKDW